MTTNKTELEQQYRAMFVANQEKPGSYAALEMLPIRCQIIELELAELDTRTEAIHANAKVTKRAFDEVRSEFNEVQQRLYEAQAALDSAGMAQYHHDNSRRQLLEERAQLLYELRLLETGLKRQVVLDGSGNVSRHQPALQRI